MTETRTSKLLAKYQEQIDESRALRRQIADLTTRFDAMVEFFTAHFSDEISVAQNVTEYEAYKRMVGRPGYTSH